MSTPSGRSYGATGVHAVHEDDMHVRMERDGVARSSVAPTCRGRAPSAHGRRGRSGVIAESRRYIDPSMTLDELAATLRAVLETRHDIRFAALFGSAVTRGIAHARDIDVALSFLRRPSLMELGLLANALEAAVGRPVDVVEIDDATTLLRWEVVKVAKPILVRDRDAWLELLARVPIEYADLRPYFERESRGLQRALQETGWSGPTSSKTKSAG